MAKSKKHTSNNKKGGKAKKAVHGSGGYFGRLLGNLAGDTLLGPAKALAESHGVDFGGLGDKLGDSLWSKASKFLGLGEYTVQHNSLYHGPPIQTAEAPEMHGNTSEIRLRRKILVSPVLSSTGFAITEYEFHPSQFDWVNTMASGFEQFEVDGCVWTYVPTATDPRSLTVPVSTGTVSFATVYDADASDFTSRATMLLTEYSQTNEPMVPQMHFVECDKSLFQQKFYYTRQSATVNDKRLTYPFITSIATEGQASAGVKLGDLWVSMDLRLKFPVQGVVPSASLVPDWWTVDGGVLFSTAYLGTTPVAALSGLGGAITGTTYTFGLQHVGQTFLVGYGLNYTVAPTTWVRPAIATTSGVYNVNQFYDTANISPVLENNATETFSGGGRTGFIQVVYVASNPAVLTFAGGSSVGGTLSGGSFFVHPWVPSLSQKTLSSYSDDSVVLGALGRFAEEEEMKLDLCPSAVSNIHECPEYGDLLAAVRRLSSIYGRRLNSEVDTASVLEHLRCTNVQSLRHVLRAALSHSSSGTAVWLEVDGASNGQAHARTDDSYPEQAAQARAKSWLTGR